MTKREAITRLYTAYVSPDTIPEWKVKETVIETLLHLLGESPWEDWADE